MGKEKVIVGFIGAGGIARSHAFALNSLKYYYNDAPDVELAAVCSAGKESRTSLQNDSDSHRHAVWTILLKMVI